MEAKDFDAFKITLASPEIIKSWSHGEVTKAETINYRTLKPEKDGLFCEKIFGPTKDYQCYCGKYKGIRYKGVVCDKCGVEVTLSRVRRERMAHLSLAAPVVHVWFVRGTPSRLGLILGVSPKSIELVTYFARYLVVQFDKEKQPAAIQQIDQIYKERLVQLKAEKEEAVSKLQDSLESAEKAKTSAKKPSGKQKTAVTGTRTKQEIMRLQEQASHQEEQLTTIYRSTVLLAKKTRHLSLLTENELAQLKSFNADTFFEVGMGAEAVLQALEQIDTKKAVTQLRKLVKLSHGPKNLKAIKRLRLFEGLLRENIHPSWMVLRYLPVIPPDLRPMVQLSGGRFATSDLNDLYRRVINRNNRLRKLLDLGAPEIILRNEKRMLQESVDALIDSSPQERAGRTRRKKLRSLSEMLRGKQGRFRQNLLGKRVDYSGRSVIVVGADLKMDQTGIPKDMALELFKPFVLRELIARGFAPNMKSAKHVLESRGPEVWDVLEFITDKHTVLLNRAPTLHRLGIQAFRPILIEGSSIQLHPAVCNAFNADFDGDQMAVHVPLSENSQKESLELMLSPFNLLRPADGSPIINFKNELGVGIYYLTAENPQKKGAGKIYGSAEEAILAYQTENLHIQASVTVYLEGKRVETTAGRLLFNEALPENLRYINSPVTKSKIRDIIAQSYEQNGIDRTVQFIDDAKDLARHFATLAGTSFGIQDFQAPKERKQILEKASAEVERIEKDFKRGLMTTSERHSHIVEVWTRATEEVAEKAIAEVDPYSIISVVIDSKSTRATKDTIRQMGGMRGVMTDPMGNIIETPITTNIIEGSTTFDGFISSRAARKGLIDTALMTAEAGYLTRRLVDVAHDVIVRELDCGVQDGITVAKVNESMVERKLLGRYVVQDVVLKGHSKPLIKANTLITHEEADLLLENRDKIDSVVVRSTLKCATQVGICQMCYGTDLSNLKPVAIGVTAGVIAAQSIGEPGTQLTMRTFHKGGIAGTDITQGLPRVEELFEARGVKDPAPISEINGQVSISESDEHYFITVRSEKTVEQSLNIGQHDSMVVHEDERVSVGDLIMTKVNGDRVFAQIDGKVSLSKTKIRVVPQSAHVERTYQVSRMMDLLVKEGDQVSRGTVLTSGHIEMKSMLEINGLEAAQNYVLEGIQLVYEGQGITINDKHIETIIRKMTERVRIRTSGDTEYLAGDLLLRAKVDTLNAQLIKDKKQPATYDDVLLGVTRSALHTESFLSAASFQETNNVLTDAALQGRVDHLIGLKENVIIGRLIPTGERARLDSKNI